ncbi:restriction endonuclease subunit S [Xanthomonas campestris]|uniref:restriction endonuclease subunit S n=1 Tax=Xanthomonas campestris TaxID=339 RepID=UPI002377E149|nr:restriction endonuclease subunit S [Xanthomonas campestris]WDL18892.1 restriction endonuclease subunit S [Xanthomonas campestris pv. campestris]WDL22976.1 restriction endonuclease subunit S [Xanthomonas campestris pv. campestris]WDL24949.1 restriction endonuclease subunit S [Xanthomonas campestris pv. campestris]WDL31148.1 restriction endonuclease subunit S [Xanthomonas campestris pv. campestris]WDL33126.1 restriction endonuclease subunit S [Xanthomonas campestris pv. campestris]
MEVKPGYKQADVGVIPDGWCIRAVFEIAGYQKGRFDDGDWIESEHITNGGYRIVQTGNIGIGEFIEKESRKYIYESSFDKLKCKELIPGDLLICRLAEPAGRACILPDLGETKVVTAVDVTIFRPSEIDADRRYLVQYFSTAKWFESVLEQVGGTTHKRISRSALGNIKVPLPSNLNEQRAIAAALSDMDALLSGLDRLITKKRAIKQAAMQQLLTGQSRLPGFSGEWDVKKLGDALVIKHGKSQKDVEANDGVYPVLATGGQIGLASLPIYQKPSVLIGRKGTINQPQYMDQPFWSVDTLFYSEMKSGNLAKFFYYRFCIIDWMQYNEASGVPSLSAKTIEAIECSLPDSAEQAAVATVLSDMDTEISVLEARRTKTRSLKQAMMQELLTGRTRLI